MRRILVEDARRKQCVKRGGLLDKLELERVEIAAPVAGVDVLQLDEALDRLAARDSEAADLVKLRYFAGMTMREAATALNISVRAAERVWTYARSFLLKEIGPEGD
jgi:RNA polymerase sigma factor (TIGR02999 family)